MLWTKRTHHFTIFRLLGAQMKVHPISHVIFESTSQFFFKLCITLQCHWRSVFCTFLAETIWFLQKEPTTVQNFRLSTAQVKFHQICTLIGYLCWKYIKFQLKKVWRSYVSWYQRVVQSLMKNIFSFKNDKNLANFHQNIWKCQNWYFHGILLSKVENVWATNLQRSYK